MYRNCPNSQEKESIRFLIAEECIKIKAKKVFSLVGTEAGMASKLPDSIEVYSAEKDRSVIRKQRKSFPDFKHTYGDASRVLLREHNFDVIWLDYFGAMSNYSNRSSFMLSLLALNKNGTLFVTTSSRNSKQDVITEMLRFCKVVMEVKYGTHSGWMKLYKLKLKLT